MLGSEREPDYRGVMSEIGVLDAAQKSFLEPYLPQDSRIRAQHETNVVVTASHAKKDPDLPFVTLTYATSLDSMIALSPGARTTLSGPETKTMTHFLRLRHDAILIGAGTATVDDPSLNCRYPGAGLQEQPRPIVVDPDCRWEVAGKKAHRLAAESAGKGPWIIHCGQPSSKDQLTQVGGDYIYLETPKQSSRLSWDSIFRELKSRGLQSVMVEGGATVINELLTLPHLVDVTIMTIAPTFLGQGGVVVSPAPKEVGGKRVNAAWLGQTQWRQFGSDVVLCGRPQ